MQSYECKDWEDNDESGGFTLGVDATFVYLTTYCPLATRAMRALDCGASVADAFAEAEVQFPLSSVERVWYASNRWEIMIDWIDRNRQETRGCVCSPPVRQAIFDELAERLGDDFTVKRRRLTVGEFIEPLGQKFLLMLPISMLVLGLMGLVALTDVINGKTALNIAGAFYVLGVAFFIVRYGLSTVIQLVRTS